MPEFYHTIRNVFEAFYFYNSYGGSCWRGSETLKADPITISNLKLR